MRAVYKDDVTEMTVEQYRCLIAHMQFWSWGIESAIKDVGIVLPKDVVIEQLFRAGWDYDEYGDKLTWEG